MQILNKIVMKYIESSLYNKPFQKINICFIIFYKCEEILLLICIYKISIMDKISSREVNGFNSIFFFYKVLTNLRNETSIVSSHSESCMFFF